MGGARQRGCISLLWYHSHEAAWRVRASVHSEQDLRDLLLPCLAFVSHLGGLARAGILACCFELVWWTRYVLIEFFAIPARTITDSLVFFF